MSLGDAAAAALRAGLGNDALRAGAPVELDGRRIPWRLCPQDAPALADALRLLTEHGLAALVRGGGTRSALGNPPARADLVLSTEGLAGVHEIDLDEGVARFGAGTRISDAVAALSSPTSQAPRSLPGWELPLEAVGEASTLGGALASGAPSLRFGAPRDAVLGLDVVLASGARTRCGGRVVKNVTGYDLAKLQVGAQGSLGVIEAAWLRLRPRPEAVAAWHVASEDPALALELARGPTVRAAVQVAGGGLWLELAGDTPAVEHGARALGERADARPASPADLDAAWASARTPATDAEACFRIDFRPSRLAAVAGVVTAVGGAWRALPERGLGFARFALAAEGPAGIEGAVASVARAAAAGGGGWRLEAAAARAKHGRDVFGELGAAASLMRALKHRFDPDGVLNPGRIAGVS